MTLGGRRFLLGSALVAASLCLALGVSLPIIKLTRFVFFSYDHSLISTVNALVRSGEYFLGITVLVFSIFLPVMKLLYLLLLATLPPQELSRFARQLRALEWFGKWSMHDVLVLSLSIFFIKSHGVYDAASVPGIYFFTAAVLLMMLAYAWLRSDTSAAAAPARKLANPSIARSFLFSLSIILATVFFVLGVLLPAIRFSTVYVWSNQHSVASIVWALYTKEEFALCFVIFMFSIVLPFTKLLYLLILVTSPNLPPAFRARSIAAMEWLGRYSMTDIMVLALMIFYINASGYSEASVLPGVYFFAASALMTMFAYGWANSVGPASVAATSLQARLAGLTPTSMPGENLAQR